MKYQDIIGPITITKLYSGCRLDRALSQLISKYSRSQIKSLIIQGKVTVNNFIITIPKRKVFEGSLVKVYDIFKNVQCLEAENIPLDIVYEDDFVLVINKPSNFVVHPGAGNVSGTLLNAILYHYPTSAIVPRAGIVQRLDKDTTGLILIAKDISTQSKLIKSFKSRKVMREYDAIVVGNIVHDGLVNQPIARHFVNRTCMSVCAFGKPAVTHYQIIENFQNYTRLKLQLETGRTHQIRVHMSYIQHPVCFDRKYGNSKCTLSLKGKYKFLESNGFSCNRQALHASMLEFFHPVTGVKITCRVPLPDDMMSLLNFLRFNFI